MIHDVNENFVHTGGSRPRRRYQYVYALFSASGFTEQAQAYALAQQISLVDMSGMSFEWLRHKIADAAAELYACRNQHHVRRFPVSWMRRELRARLETALPGTLVGDEADWTPDMATNAPRFRTAAAGIIEAFAAELLTSERSELLLGFPASPFILVLGADDPDLFIEYTEGHPTHAVRTAAGRLWQSRGMVSVIVGGSGCLPARIQPPGTGRILDQRERGTAIQAR